MGKSNPMIQHKFRAPSLGLPKPQSPTCPIEPRMPPRYRLSRRPNVKLCRGRFHKMRLGGRAELTWS